MSGRGTPPRVDVAVVGAGLAGCLVAEALLNRAPARSVLLIDDDAPDAGWKNPAALCHPVPGASLRPAPHQVDAFTVAAARWKREPTAREVTLHRALPPGPRSARMLKTLAEAQRAFEPAGVRLQHEGEHVVIHPAYVVRLNDFITERRRTLEHDGVQRMSHRVLAVSDEGDGVCLHTTDLDVHARCVVFAGGAGFLAASGATPAAPGWPDALETEGGETVAAPMGGPKSDDTTRADINTAHTARGAFVVAHGEAMMRLGATHVATDAPMRETNVIGGELAARLGLDVDPASFTAVYRGARAFYRRDRLPLAGATAASGRRFLLTALGGTGLLWAPYLAQRVAAATCGAGDVPDAFSPRRVPAPAVDDA